MKTKMFLLRSAVLALMLGCSASQADVIFDSTTTAQMGSGYIEYGDWHGQSFTMGGSSATLTSVVLTMNSAIDTSGNFFVSLYGATGAGSTPGISSLATLTGSANPATAGNYSYNGSYLLAADTTYYIVAGVSSGAGDYSWGLHTGEDAGTIGYSYSYYQGGVWAAPNASLTFNMQINGDISPVPEPAAWGWGSCAFLGLVCIVQRRWRPMTNQK